MILTGMDQQLSKFLLFVYVLVGTFTDGSDKKGIGLAPASFMCDDLKAMPCISWWYNWGASAVKQRNLHGCVDFDQFIPLHVPMSWGNGTQFPNYNIQTTAKYLLGFNEPNHVSQSNLTPAQAAELWPYLEQIADEMGLTLVSPAVAPCGKNCVVKKADQWLREFFGNCSGCRVDHIATHVYYCTAEEVMQYIATLYEFNKPIWVTEFSCPNVTNVTVQLEFMKAILPEFEKDPNIIRYAWYISRLLVDDMYVKSSVSLLKRDVSELTELGQYYCTYEYNPSATTNAAGSSSPSTTATSAVSTGTASSTVSTGTASSTVRDKFRSTEYPSGGISLLNTSKIFTVAISFAYITITFA